MEQATKTKVKVELTMEEIGHLILALYAVAGKEGLIQEARASIEEEGMIVNPLPDKEDDQLFNKLVDMYRW